MCDVTWHTLNDSISLSITFWVDRLLDVMLKFQARFQNFKSLISAFWLAVQIVWLYLKRGSERRGWITGAWTVIGLVSIVVESNTESSSSLAFSVTGRAVCKLRWINFYHQEILSFRGQLFGIKHHFWRFYPNGVKFSFFPNFHFW